MNHSEMKRYQLSDNKRMYNHYRKSQRFYHGFNGIYCEIETPAFYLYFKELSHTSLLDIYLFTRQQLNSTENNKSERKQFR